MSSDQTQQTEQGPYNPDGRPSPGSVQLADMLSDDDRRDLDAVLARRDDD